MAITKVRGTYDLLPNESMKTTKLENLFRDICSLYNYKEIRTPIFEMSQLFHRTVGETSDLVRKETYDFKDRGERNITLRPEGTAGVVRGFIENKMYTNPINKLFYIGNMFRYERPQKGRYRQFEQLGVEAFGSNDPQLDAEVISIAVTLIKALGLNNVKVRLNSLGDDESRKNYKKALVEYFTPYKDILCEDCKLRLENNPLRILDCKIDKDSEIFKNAPKMRDFLSDESKEHFELVKKHLALMKINYFIDDNLVRGLDYYTYTIFEVEADIKGFGSQNVLGGGGRYNNLVESLEGPKTPAVGMAFGIERLLFAIESENKKIPVDDSVDLFIISLGLNAKLKVSEIINNLRVGGLVCETDYLDKGLKGQFKEAEKEKAKFVAILGDNELTNEVINLKDQRNGEESVVRINDLYNTIVSKMRTCSCGNSHDNCCCGSECSNNVEE